MDLSLEEFRKMVEDCNDDMHDPIRALNFDYNVPKHLREYLVGTFPFRLALFVRIAAFDEKLVPYCPAMFRRVKECVRTTTEAITNLQRPIARRFAKAFLNTLPNPPPWVPEQPLRTYKFACGIL